MKSIFLAIVAVVAFTSIAEAAGCGGMVCNNNPTCQSLRNAGSCDAARAAGGTGGSASSSSARQKCPAGTAWSSYNNECSRHNWCWQKLGLPNSSQSPTGPALAKLEACKAGG